MARLTPTSYQLPEYDFAYRGPIDQQPTIQALQALQDTSNALPPGQIVGGLIKFQVADGYAYYLITKESPLTVQHVEFMDNYKVMPPMIRGLDKQYILGMLNSDRAMARLFSRKP